MNKRPFKWHDLLRMHRFWYALCGIAAVLAIVLSIYLNTHTSAVPQPFIPAPIQVPAKPVVTKKPSVPGTPRTKISSIIVPSIATGTATITNASPSVFAYAHGTVSAGDKFIVGTADRAGNPYASNKLFMFTDPRFVDRYVTVLLPHRGDIETMAYDPASNKAYFLLTGAGDFELYSFDVATLYLYEVASSTALDPGQKPAIVTDGTYVYGITNTSPSTVFKVKIADGTISTNSKGHISSGHSAAIGIANGKTELYFGGGMDNGFEKADAETLNSLNKTDLSPCALTDDLPYEKIDGAGGYVYVGCEIEPYGYRIRTSDFSVDRFLLPGSSLGLFIFGDDLYNAAQDGNIDVYPHGNLGVLERSHIASSSLLNAHSQEVEPNELFFSDSTERLYFTAWWGIPGLYTVSTSSAQ